MQIHRKCHVNAAQQLASVTASNDILEMLKVTGKVLVALCIAWTILSVIAGGWILLHALPKTRIQLLGGDHVAIAKLHGGLTVQVEMAVLFPGFLAEYERRLTVCDGSWFGCRSHWLSADWGGHRAIKVLERQSDSKIVLSMSIEEILISEDLELEEIYPPATTNADCLGVFEFFADDNKLAKSVRRGTFRFQSAPIDHKGNCNDLFR